MELGRDWQALESMWSPRKKETATRALLDGTIWVVVEGDRVIKVLDPLQGNSLSWQGRSVLELKAAFKGRTFQIIERNAMDEWIHRSLKSARGSDHFLGQLESFKKETGTTQHFLYRAFQGWWKKVLPVRFAVALRAADQKTILVFSVQRGEIDQFAGFDSAAQKPEQFSKEVAAIRERLGMPVQGFWLEPGTWAEWTQMQFPWRAIFKSVKNRTTQIFPFRWGVALLFALRGLIGL